MSNNNAFHTGFLVTKDPLFPKGPYKGRRWRISFRRDKRDTLAVRNSREVMIHTSSWKTAQQAVNLIHGALALVNADASYSQLSGRRSFAYPESTDKLSDFPKDLLGFVKSDILWTPDIPLACKIAAKVSFSRRHSYALTKYSVSCSVFSTPIVDLDPSHSPNLRVSGFFEDHVRLATSIFLAYSAIEELDLHIKASEKNPSRNEKGEWNPVVRADLEQRLLEAGVDLDEPSKALSKPSWASGSVKDVEVSLVDALADANWLRSKVSAHGFSKLASSLSPYDVANVQHLARRLILETLGFWRYHDKMLRARKHPE